MDTRVHASVVRLNDEEVEEIETVEVKRFISFLTAAGEYE